VEKKRTNSAPLVMQVGELSLMEIQLKSTSVCFVMDETK
tara:strand:- start:877 stop:993 length:117 start_codon:yes stop_codon:yes gene_type:complete